MLCGYELQKKCEHYWPEHSGKTMRYGQVKVTLINVEEYADFNINRLRVAKGVGLIHKQIFIIANKIVELMHLT